MNSLWQVARTYLGRWRFWIFGGAYAWIALWIVPRYWAPPETTRDQGLVAAALLLTLILSAIVGILAALHLRRLLSGPAAHAVPGFWGPHLLVGAIVSLAIWFAVPWAQANMTGMSPLRVIALSSLSGTLSALVLLGPPAVCLLGLLPVSIVWIATERPGSALLVRFCGGEEPILSVGAIVLAIAAYPIAALVLWRTRDRAATFSDDLVVDRSHEVASRWKQPFLQFRDGAIEWKLNPAGGFAWTLRRWRIPCAVSWSEIGLIVALMTVIMAATGLATRSPDAAWMIAAVAGIGVLFLPLSSWRFRCMALSCEFTRPVTRRQFVRQFMAAMLCDFAAWTALAALVSSLGYLPMVLAGEPGVPKVIGVHAVGLWSGAMVLYGTALATIRLRYWLPWFLGLLLGSFLAGGYSIYYLGYWWVKVLEFPDHPVVRIGLVLVVFSAIGLLLIATTYRRWLRMEIA